MADSTLITIIRPEGGLSLLNSNLAAVTTPFVAILSDRCSMLPGHISRIEDELTQRPDTDMLVFDTVERDDDGWTTLCSPKADTLVADHLSGRWLSTDNVILSRKLVGRIGPIDESLRSAALIDYIGRALLAASSLRKLSGEPTLLTSPTSSPAPELPELVRVLDGWATTLRNRPASESLIPMIHISLMVIAGQMMRRGDKKESTRLSDRVLDNVDRAGARIRLGFVRDTETLFGRGGRTLGCLLLRPSSSRQGTVTEK